MAELFNIRLEIDLSEFTSTVTDGGDLSWAAAAALAGTAGGMSVLIDDTTAIYGQKNQTAPLTNQIRYRFYLKRNTFTINSGEICGINYASSGTSPFQIFRVFWGYDGSNYLLRGVGMADSGVISGFNHNISDAEHYVEVHVERASSDVAADGRIRWWIDGALQDTWNNVDNYDVFNDLSSLRFGAPALISATSAGTFYIDEIAANDDGSEIGPYGGSLSLVNNVPLKSLVNDGLAR